MTVSSETNKSGPYAGNNVTTAFDYRFRIVDRAHIEVIRTEAGVETPLAVDIDYTVSGVGVDEGGQVHLLVAPTNEQSITNIRKVPFVQETDLENQGAYYPETVERALDLAVMRDQELSERLDRALTIPPSADPSGLSGLVSDILRLKDSADNIDIVADNIDAVKNASDHMADILAAPGAAEAAANSASDASDDKDIAVAAKDDAIAAKDDAEAAAASINIPPVADAFYQQSNPAGSLVARSPSDANEIINAVPTYATTASLSARTIPASVKVARVAGYANLFDSGGHQRKRVNAQPAWGGIRSQDRYKSDGTTDATNGGWWDVDEAMPNEAMFGGVTSASNANRTAAIQALLNYCASAKRDAFIIGSHTITAKITIPAGLTVYGGAPTSRKLTLGYNGDMFDVNGFVHIYSLFADGTGQTYTGRCFHVVDGSDQIFRDCLIQNFAAPCLEYDNGKGSRAQVFGGLWQRSNTANPAIVYPSTDTTSTHRDILFVHCGGGCLADLGVADNVGIIGCDTTNIIFNAGVNKVRVIGTRIANGAVPVTLNVLGLEHVFSGCTVSGNVTFGATYSAWDSSNRIAAGYTISDTSGGSTNTLDIPAAAYTPVWTADTTNPAIGNGTLSGEYEMDGRYCVARIKMIAGSTTTFGSGPWHFSLPKTPAANGQASMGNAWALDSGSNYLVGVTKITSSTVYVVLGAAPVNHVTSAIPITWASGDQLLIEIRYRVN